MAPSPRPTRPARGGATTKARPPHPVHVPPGRARPRLAGAVRAAFRYDLRELAAIFAGGCLGTLARAGLEQIGGNHASQWPWATFAVNVSGCLLLGYFITRLQERLPISTYRRPLLGTGVCGGLTTFSAFQTELIGMLDAHRYVIAAGYAAGSVASGFLGVALATALVRRVRAFQ